MRFYYRACVFGLLFSFVLISAVSAKEKFYEVEVKLDKAKKTATVMAKGAGGYHCNVDYPWKIKVVEPGSDERVYKKTDAKVFSKESVEFVIPYTHAGKVTALLKLSVCDDKQCRMEKVELKW